MAAAIAFPGFFLILGAFVLLLLNTISTPIVKSLYFLNVFPAASTVSGVAVSGSLKLGTLGYCSSGLSATAASISANVGSGCSATKLGYSLPSSLFTSLSSIDGFNINGLNSSLIKGLSYLMVLQPIAAGFAVVSLFFAFFAWCCSSRFMEILAFIFTIFSSIVAWVAWACVMALFEIAKKRIKDNSDGVLSASLGNCIWMGLAAAIALSLALIFTCCGMFGSYSNRDRRSRGDYDNRDMTYAGNGVTGGYAAPGKAGWRSWGKNRGTATY